MNESALLNDSKFVSLMKKLNDEQSKIYADKKLTDEKTKEAIDAANRKVIHLIYYLAKLLTKQTKELQDELEFRSKHFQAEVGKLKQENQMLKETGSISAKQSKEIKNKENSLQGQVTDLENKIKSLTLELHK